MTSISYVRFKYLWHAWTLPATIACSDNPNPRKGPSYHLSPKWRHAVQEINTPHALNYLFKDHSGWVNALADDGTPIIERVAFSGNVARTLAFYRGYYLLDTLSPTDQPPPADDTLHIHRFTCVDPLMHPRQPGDGFNAYVFLLASGPMWVHQSKVEVFRNPPPPILPGATTTPPPAKPRRRKKDDE